MKHPDSMLDIFVDGVLIGHLNDTHPLSLTYSDAALIAGGKTIVVPFADVIPLKPGIISTASVEAFFENLLPEGDQRLLIESRYHVSTIFGLLSEVGGDTAGSVVILGHGCTPQPNEYIPVSWTDLRMMLSGGFSQDKAKSERLVLSGHVAISGAQNKLLISLGEAGEPLIPLGASISTHILKPDIIRPGLKVWSSAVNETLVMKVAGLCGLPVAEVSYIEEVRACLVKRYDRLTRSHGNISRMYQADLCQLLGVPSTVKYENDGGPSFKDCYRLVKTKSTSPSMDCLNLLRWLMFNLYVGNNDSHGKNISMIGTSEGLRLAPFYDLMCTKVYAGLSNNFAFKIGDNFHSGLISRKDLLMLADDLGVSRQYLLGVAVKMAEKINAAIPIAVDGLNKNMSYAERVVVERMTYLIQGLVKKASTRLLYKTRYDALPPNDTPCL